MEQIKYRTIENLTFHLTCEACPEQYYVYDDLGNRVAYVRFRHNNFTVEKDDCGGQMLVQILNNEYAGGVLDPNDRKLFLPMTARVINKHLP